MLPLPIQPFFVVVISDYLLPVTYTETHTYTQYTNHTHNTQPHTQTHTQNHTKYTKPHTQFTKPNTHKTTCTPLHTQNHPDIEWVY